MWREKGEEGNGGGRGEKIWKNKEGGKKRKTLCAPSVHHSVKGGGRKGGGVGGRRG